MKNKKYFEYEMRFKDRAFLFRKCGQIIADNIEQAILLVLSEKERWAKKIPDLELQGLEVKEY